MTSKASALPSNPGLLRSFPRQNGEDSNGQCGAGSLPVGRRLVVPGGGGAADPSVPSSQSRVASNFVTVSECVRWGRRWGGGADSNMLPSSLQSSPLKNRKEKDTSVPFAIRHVKWEPVRNRRDVLVGFPCRFLSPKMWTGRRVAEWLKRPCLKTQRKSDVLPFQAFGHFCLFVC